MGVTKRVAPPPPPDAAADPEPGMIAKMRGPLSVKNHSFAVCARPLPVLQSAPEKSRALLISPLQEQPGFSLGSIHSTDAEEIFSELLRVDGVLRSSCAALPIASGPGWEDRPTSRTCTVRAPRCRPPRRRSPLRGTGRWRSNPPGRPPSPPIRIYPRVRPTA